ncbi:MAG: hypothetical protein ACOC9Y_00150 [Chloroflexota bacterium]
MPRYGKSPRDVRLKRARRETQREPVSYAHHDATDEELLEFEELTGEVARERSETTSRRSSGEDIEDLAGEPFRESNGS